jgi:tetratricopeptide (TPR) repeat protein
MKFVWTRAALFLVLFATTFGVTAQEQFRPTEAEYALLPAFCRVRVGGNSSSPQYQAMAANYGRNNFMHMHHYCFALNFSYRALKATREQDKKHLNTVAKGNYEYIVEHTEPSFSMRPKVYVELGQVLLRLNSPGEALKYFLEAVRFNPKYVSAYAALIDFHRRSGNGRDALEVATKGLRYVPNSKYLQKAYIDAGGKRPFPEPIAQPEESEPPVEGSVAKTEEDAAAASPTASETPMTTVDQGAADVQTEGGCRFCPPAEIQERWREDFENDN